MNQRDDFLWGVAFPVLLLHYGDVPGSEAWVAKIVAAGRRVADPASGFADQHTFLGVA